MMGRMKRHIFRLENKRAPNRKKKGAGTRKFRGVWRGKTKSLIDDRIC